VRVVLPSGGQKVTEWVYGVTTAGGSGLNSNDLVKEVRHPDPSTGASSSSSKDVLTVNALGQALTMTDRNGTVHTYSYDVVGRQTADAITTLGSGVDGTVRRLTTAYDTQGNPYLFTAYDASSGGNVVNQVKRDFNGLGQLTSEWQSHSGAVTGSSPRIQYAYSEMPSGANHSRLTSVTYASGYTVNYNYASGLDANISRLSSLSDASNTLEAYSYLGLGTVVKRAHSQSGVDLSYIKLSTESVGDAGDQYTGLDRFGRIVDQRWINGSNTDVDRYQYGYDRDGNRLYKDNKVIASLSEVYTYDSLNQLASYKLGTLNGTKTDVTGSPSNSQSWDYDAVGNWDSITTNSTTQTRTANKQNEITAVSGATTPTYDSNGNLTTDENNYRFVYDAWNKVVQVKNSSNVVIVTYGRDAMHRHVTDTVGSTVTDRFFSSDWQVLETKVGSNTVTRNVWSPVYVDGLVLRDRDTDANGTLDERLYALQDANWNTTALANTSGTVQERYTYTPFGQVTFRDGSGSTLSSSAKDWVFLHQGGERIAAGDYEFRNRVYSPTLGRWLSNDPLGFEAGDQNWYRAIGNNPGNGNDPSGLQEGERAFRASMALMGMRPPELDEPRKKPTEFQRNVQFQIFNIGINFTPYISGLRDIQEVWTGYDFIEQKKIEGWDYALTVIGAIAPGVSAAALRSGSKIVKKIASSADEIAPNVDDFSNLPKLKYPANLEYATPEAYAGVKQTSEYLQKEGVPRHIRKKVLESFDRKSMELRIAGDFEYGLRYYDNINAMPKGRYLFEQFPANRNSLALPPEWNEMLYFKQFQIRPGTKFLEGPAAAQGLYPGGQKQRYILDLADLLEP